MSLLKGLLSKKSITNIPVSPNTPTLTKTPFPQTTEPSKFKEGYLLVEINGGFRKKYIKTSAEGLTIFENERDKSGDFIPLTKSLSVDFVPPKEKSQKHCFKLKYQNGQKYFVADKEQDMRAWMEYFKIDYPKFLSGDNFTNSFSGMNNGFTGEPLLKSYQSEIIRKVKKEDIQKIKQIRKSSTSDRKRGSLNLLQTTELGRSLSRNSFNSIENDQLKAKIVEEDDGYTTKDVCGPVDGFDEEEEEKPFPVIEVKKKNSKFDFENFTFNLTWPYEEDEIATCAAEILKRDPKYRTNEEQAYVIALEDYQKKLQEHMKKHKTKPLHNKATGTCILTIPKEERKEKELEYTKDIELYLNYICKEIHYLPPDLYSRVIKDSIEIFNKPKEQRTKNEQLYIEKISMISREIYVQEIQNGLISQHTILHDL